MYGFYDECLRKYGSVNVWRYCCEIFDYMSLSAMYLIVNSSIEDKIFCVHGGLSPTINTLDQVHSTNQDSINRPQARGAPWRIHVRFALVWPRRFPFPYFRDKWLGIISKRCRLFIWKRCGRNFYTYKRARFDRSCPPTSPGRI